MNEDELINLRPYPDYQVCEHMNAWMSESKQLKEVLHMRAGLMVTERNWLEVYPYTKWGGNDSLPHLQEGQTFMPSHLMLKEVSHLDLLCTA